MLHDQRDHIEVLLLLLDSEGPTATTINQHTRGQGDKGVGTPGTIRSSFGGRYFEMPYVSS